MSTYDVTNETSAKDFTKILLKDDVIIADYSGTYREIKLPAGTYTMECWGARGGKSYYGDPTSVGGKGGYAKGTIKINSPTTIFLYVGGAGGDGDRTQTTPSTGGFNGGGSCSPYFLGGSGGGGTDIRFNTTDLSNRKIVAGGGGGGAYWRSSSAGYMAAIGGDGGGLVGGNGAEDSTSGDSLTSVATGGTQSSGGNGAYIIGAAGQDGKLYEGGAPRAYSGNAGGAGGGGYYGGGGGTLIAISSTRYMIGSGAGGSSYLDNDFTDRTFATGIQDGNGYITITTISLGSGFSAYCKINSDWKDVSKAYVKVNGSWKNISKMYCKVNGSWHLIGGGSPGPGPTPTSAELHVYAPGATAIWAMNGSTRADGVQDTEATGYWNIPVSIGTWNVNGTKSGQSAAVKPVSVTSEQRYTINDLCYASTTLDNTYWIINDNAWQSTQSGSTWNDCVCAYCDMQVYSANDSSYKTYSNNSTETTALLYPWFYPTFPGFSFWHSYACCAVIKTEDKYSIGQYPDYVYHYPIYISGTNKNFWGVEENFNDSSLLVNVTKNSKGRGINIKGNVLFESDWTKINNYYTFLQNNATKYTTESAWKTAVNALQ